MARWWAEFKEPEPAELATGAGPADMANRPGFRSRALRPAYGVGETVARYVLSLSVAVVSEKKDSKVAPTELKPS